MKLPEDMMEALRGRRRLEESDTAEDEAINAMEPERIVHEVAGWYLGDPSWAETFYRWFKSVGIITKEKAMSNLLIPSDMICDNCGKLDCDCPTCPTCGGSREVPIYRPSEQKQKQVIPELTGKKPCPDCIEEKP